MRLTEVQLLTGDLPAQQHFYTQILGLPSHRAGDVLSLQIGRSRLEFRQAPPGWRGVYHFAFNIPENRLEEAKGWMAARAPLIVSSTGEDTFHFAGWNADSLYFWDGAGNIGELIARHTLANANSAPFSAQSLLSVSEVGVATEDVPASVRLLQTQLGVGIYDGAGSDTFTAVGDEEGLLIVVKQGRIWFPDTGQPADLLPLRVAVVRASGPPGLLSGPPYQVQAGQGGG